MKCRSCSCAFFVFLLLFSTSGFAFTPDVELERHAANLDRKYFPIFLNTIEMIKNRQFQGLNLFFSSDLLNDSRSYAEQISIEKWSDHPEIFYKFSRFKHSKEPPYRISFPIDWGGHESKGNTWVFYFQNLMWLNEYLEAETKGDRKSTLVAFKVIQDWITTHAEWPPKNGKYVFGDHSTAARLRVFLKALRAYQASNCKDQQFFNLLITGIFNHIAFMSTNEKYLNWHNHGIIFDVTLLEALADFTAFKPRLEILDLASRRVVEQFRFAFTSEGVHKEHSPCYHLFMTRKLLQTIELMRKTALASSGHLDDLAENASPFFTYILKPDGRFPRFGDCSGKQSWFYGTGLMSAYYDRHPELKFALLSGREGKKPAYHTRVFPESGWAIFRDKWPPSVYAAIQSDFHSQAHYHEDDTSFVLHAFGHDLVIDPGLHTYNKGSLDIYMRQSRAHNVLIVDDTDFESHLSNTGLSGITRFKINDNPKEPSNAIVEMTHPHYEHLGVKLHRQFGQMENTNFLIKDVIDSASSHKYTQLFHLAPNAKIQTQGKDCLKVTWSNYQYALWLKSEFDTYDVVEGSMNPVQGWHFPEFGVSASNPVLRLKKNSKSATFLTVISLTNADGKPEWGQISRAAHNMSEAIEKLPRLALDHQPVPPRWKKPRRS